MPHLIIDGQDIPQVTNIKAPSLDPKVKKSILFRLGRVFINLGCWIANLRYEEE